MAEEIFEDCFTQFGRPFFIYGAGHDRTVSLMIQSCQ